MSTPAGWYDDGSGRLRWWDGAQWTEHFAPDASATDADAPAADAPAATGTLVDDAPAAEAPAATETPTTTEAPGADAPAAEALTASETPTATEVPAVSEVPEFSAVPEQGSTGLAQAPADASRSATESASADAQAPTTADAHAPTSDAADTVVLPPADADAVAAPPAGQEWVTPGGADAFPTAAASTTYPGQPPAPSTPGYPAQGTYPNQPAYQGQSAYPTQAGYPGQTAYPGQAPYPGQGGYPTQAPYAVAPAGPRKLSVLGLVGLGLAALGFILAFIPIANFFSWLPLGAGFIVSLISLFLKNNNKWPGITGLCVSVVGFIAAAVMALVFLFAFASQVSPSSQPSFGSDDGTSQGTDPESGTDDGFGTPEVVEGSMGEPVTVKQTSGTGEVTITSATWGTTNGSDFEASNGGYLVVDLTWDTIDGTTYVNPLYFSVVTAEGADGDYDIFGDATLESGEFDAGETTQGTISFDVAQSDSYDVVIMNELFQEVARVTVEASPR